MSKNMSKNIDYVIVLSYPSYSKLNSIEYNTFGVFSSKEEMFDLLEKELDKKFKNIQELEEFFKIEKVPFFKGKNLLRKELLNDILS